ncbi:MAG: aminoacyl-tRNA hydrolase [Patescibacteria group bacterium]|jgi:PTH1 family peptidyl-tRNA hydrolase
MKIIVGLGNPGKEYTKTRHNCGFRFVDELIIRPELSPVGGGLSFSLNNKFESEIAETTVAGDKVIIAKPQTFMNLSGKAVAAILSYYKVDIDDLVVVLDDKDLPVGQARIRREGSSAGQKGLQNIIDILGTDKFVRIRIGISEFSGDPTESDPPERPLETKELVLSNFSDREEPIIQKIIAETVTYALPFILGREEQLPDHTLHVV